MDEYKQQLGRSMDVTGPVKPENPLYGLMREYVQAKESFDSACQNYAMAAQQRESAEKILLSLSEKVAQVVQQGVYDPTLPQVQPAPSPMAAAGNHAYQGGLNPRY